MGLDGVEIVMAVEERFGITIADEEAEITLTPGKLIDLVLAKVRKTDFSQCESRRAFYALRRALMKLTGVSHQAVRPEAELASFFHPTSESGNGGNCAPLWAPCVGHGSSLSQDLPLQLERLRSPWRCFSDPGFAPRYGPPADWSWYSRLDIG